MSRSPEASTDEAEHPSGFLARATYWVLAIGGVVGAIAAFALTIDRIKLLQDPAFVPSCSISPLLSCGTVMTSSQAELFGFPNPLIGLVTFPVVAALGVIGLTGGRIPRVVWLGLQVGVVAGTVLVHWLIAQSLYVINTLCPYCMVVWIVMITVCCYTTLHNLTAGNFGAPRRWALRLADYHGLIVTVWLLAIAVLVAIRFWSYWMSLLP